MVFLILLGKFPRAFPVSAGKEAMEKDCSVSVNDPVCQILTNDRKKIRKWKNLVMKLSTRSRYGVRLMLDMALHCNGGPARLGDIAKRQAIPLKYLEQIIIVLKKAGYVKSVRGPKGGHMPAKPPGEITVGEVVSLLEGGIKLTKCTAQPEVCDRSATCITRFLWKEATDAIRERLDTVTFSDLIKRSASIGVLPECGESLREDRRAEADEDPEKCGM